MSKKYHKRIFNSLALQMVLPVVIVTIVLGAGLYFFVLRSVSDFAHQQINTALRGISKEVYSICDQNFTELIEDGQLGNSRAVRVKKARTVGAIEDYVKRSHLECRIYDNRHDEFLLMRISPPAKKYLAQHQAREMSSCITHNGELCYYITHFNFKPWDWRVDLIKDTTQYAPLMDQVKAVYFVTGILLVFSILVTFFLLEKLLRSPINKIITSIRAGKSPDYKGIYELEFLSDNIAQMKQSLEQRSRWIEKLYRIAVTNRGEYLFDRLADTISDALGLNVLITRFVNDEKGFVAVASATHGLNSTVNFSPDGLPLQQIIVKKQAVIFESGVSKNFPSARCLSDTAAKCYAGLPVFSHTGDVIGVINTFGKERTFSDWDLNLIKTVSQMIGAEFELMDKENEKEHFREQVFRAQKLESLGLLAGGIAHDFNNLLMGLQGNASLLLLNGLDKSEFYERIKHIEEYVQRGVSLTRQLLGIAKGAKHEVRPYNINSIIRKSAEMFGRTRKEVRITAKYQEDVFTIELDRWQIEQVLLNLFINAAQAMPAGGEIYLKTQNVLLEEDFVSPHNVKPGRYVKISVADTGIGMKKEICERIFDPFFTTKEIGGGTGLGLSSAYGIIKQHNGFIDVGSKLGCGTTFYIYLPASEEMIRETTCQQETAFEGKGTILFVDDEKIVTDVGSKMLEKLGYKVLTASSGKEAVDIYQHNKGNIDLVLLDMIMPEMDGGETFDRLWQIDPEVKVMLSSGYSVDGRAQGILDRGCNGFIQKPFDLIELSRKLKELLMENNDNK